MGFALKAFAWGCLLGALLVIRCVCTWLSAPPTPRPEQRKRVLGRNAGRLSAVRTPDSQGPGGFPLAHGGRLSFPSCLFLSVPVAPRVVPPQTLGEAPVSPPAPCPAPLIDSTLGRGLTGCGSAGPADPGRQVGASLGLY